MWVDAADRASGSPIGCSTRSTPGTAIARRLRRALRGRVRRAAARRDRGARGRGRRDPARRRVPRVQRRPGRLGPGEGRALRDGGRLQVRRASARVSAGFAFPRDCALRPVDTGWFADFAALPPRRAERAAGRSRTGPGGARFAARPSTRRRSTGPSRARRTGTASGSRRRGAARASPSGRRGESSSASTRAVGARGRLVARRRAARRLRRRFAARATDAVVARLRERGVLVDSRDDLRAHRPRAVPHGRRDRPRHRAVAEEIASGRSSAAMSRRYVAEVARRSAFGHWIASDPALAFRRLSVELVEYDISSSVASSLAPAALRRGVGRDAGRRRARRSRRFPRGRGAAARARPRLRGAPTTAARWQAVQVTNQAEYDEQLSLLDDGAKIARRIQPCDPRGGPKIGRRRARREGARSRRREGARGRGLRCGERRARGDHRRVSAERGARARRRARRRAGARSSEHCATCHGVTGQANTPKAADAQPEARELPRPERRRRAHAVSRREHGALRRQRARRWCRSRSSPTRTAGTSRSSSWRSATRHPSPRRARRRTRSPSSRRDSDASLRASSKRRVCRRSAIPGVLSDLRRRAPYDDRGGRSSARARAGQARSRAGRHRARRSRRSRKGQIIDATSRASSPPRRRSESIDASIVARIEDRFMALRAAIDRGDGPAELGEGIGAVLAELTRAESKLGEGAARTSFVSTAISSGGDPPARGRRGRAAHRRAARHRDAGRPRRQEALGARGLGARARRSAS